MDIRFIEALQAMLQFNATSIYIQSKQLQGKLKINMLIYFDYRSKKELWHPQSITQLTDTICKWLGASSVSAIYSMISGSSSGGLQYNISFTLLPFKKNDFNEDRIFKYNITSSYSLT